MSLDYKSKPNNMHEITTRQFDPKIYDANYFHGDAAHYIDYDEVDHMLYYLADSVHKVMHSFVSAEVSGRDLRVIDFGAAYGHAVHQLSNQGWQSVGLELSPFAIDKGRSRYEGIDLFQFDMTDMSSYPKFPLTDLVVNFDVLEHIPSASARDWLAAVSKFARWGAFMVGCKFEPGDEIYTEALEDISHLNCHDKLWWYNEIASYGELDFRAEIGLALMVYHAAMRQRISWPFRWIVVKFFAPDAEVRNNNEEWRTLLMDAIGVR